MDMSAIFDRRMNACNFFYLLSSFNSKSLIYNVSKVGLFAIEGELCRDFDNHNAQSSRWSSQESKKH